jgi:hypothetical protein
MNTEQFKELFSATATAHGFTWACGGWFRQSPECLVVLNLQKSNFGNYFDLNIKVYIQGLFGKEYSPSKELVKRNTGDVFLRPPQQYDECLDLGNTVSSGKRRTIVEGLFLDFLNPLANDALSRAGLVSLAERGLVFLLPAVRQELISEAR